MTVMKRLLLVALFLFAVRVPAQQQDTVTRTVLSAPATAALLDHWDAGKLSRFCVTGWGVVNEKILITTVAVESLESLCGDDTPVIAIHRFGGPLMSDAEIDDAQSHRRMFVLIHFGREEIRIVLGQRADGSTVLKHP